MADFSLRLVLLMREIPREPQFVSTQTLLERLLDAGHEVSLRTVQRDLQALSVHFPLVQNKPQGRGKTGLGWAFAANSQSISFPVMGSAAALTLMLARQHLQSLLPSEVLNHLEPFVQEAQNLLNTQDSGQYRDWFDKVRIAPPAMSCCHPGSMPARWKPSTRHYWKSASSAPPTTASPNASFIPTGWYSKAACFI